MDGLDAEGVWEERGEWVCISFFCQCFNVGAVGMIPGLTPHIHFHLYSLNRHQPTCSGALGMV